MFIIEGNIGTGKSSLLKALQHAFPFYPVVFESVNNWQKKAEGQSILKNFYENPHRWAYTMEFAALTSRVQEHIKNQSARNPHLVERSIYSGYYCFAKNCYEQGFLKHVEWQMYNEWFHFVASKRCAVPQGFIYLQADPAVSYERVKKRNRTEESSIPLAYLEQIHAKYEDLFLHKTNIHPDLEKVPVLIIDCNKDFITHVSHLQTCLQDIKTFIQEHKTKKTAPFSGTALPSFHQSTNQYHTNL